MGAVVFWDGDFAAASQRITNGTLYQSDPSIFGYYGADYDTNPDNIVSFDNIKLPGICRIKGLTKCNVKNKKAPGTKGNKPTVLGYAPAEFDVICMYWTPGQLTIIKREIDRLWNVPMANPKYVGRTKKIDPAQFTHAIYHPDLDLFNIRYCVINQVSLPEPGKEVGTKQIQIKCTENRDPGKKDVTATPKPAPVKRHINFNGTLPKNSSQLPAPSQDPANMSLAPQLFTPSGGDF